MRILKVNENDAHQRVDKFLQKALPTLPKNLMYKYIRNKKIKVNGARCEISTKLTVGDEFTCYIAEEFFEIEKDTSFLQAPSHINILFEDANILVMNKEKGLLAHSDEVGQVDCLVNRMKHYLFLKKEFDPGEEQSFTPALCHRIDRNTQGLVIGAKNAQALRGVNEAIKARSIDKFYYCIVEGTMERSEDTLVCFHNKKNQKVSISSYEKEGYTRIETGYRVVRKNASISVLEVSLLTGKSHQIRAVFAHLGHPLYGDVKYGAAKRAYKYQALCAYRIQFHKMPSCLSYLNEVEVKIKEKDIDFLMFIK